MKQTYLFDSKFEELKAKHREIKNMMLTLLEKAESPNITKQKMKDELFKIYMGIK